jgi:hypothetical protein
MADCIVPQEYGVTIEEKRDIGTKVKRTRKTCFNGSSLLETLSKQTLNTLLCFLLRLVGATDVQASVEWQEILP